MGLGDRIKFLRGHENQTDFGTRFGASRNTVMRYENETSQPDASFLVALCEHYDVGPNWLLLGEGEMRVEPRHRETAVDMAKDLLLGDQDAARRRRAKIKEVGVSMRAAVETANQVWQEIGGDKLPEPRTEAEKQLTTALAGLRARYEAAELGRLAVEQQADKLASSAPAMPWDDFHLGMGDSMELLVNIHKSGNQVLIRAINANLLAFNEAIENRERSETTINAIRDMKDRMVSLEEEMAKLRAENLVLHQKLLHGRDEEPEAAAV